MRSAVVRVAGLVGVLTRLCGVLAIIGSTALVGACGDDLETSCLASLPEDCTPLYAPTFDNVFTNTLSKSCGIGGAACHTSAGNKGGLALDDQDGAYAMLLDGRVVAGDPACSLLMARLEAAGESAMPPGSPLSEAERCSIAAWIRAGAAK
ncbi:MAG: hypothetical protein EXR75_09100 [Myxococcales bacterium]|nr:hypothetical protein [Myxococcales bacterium]